MKIKKRIALIVTIILSLFMIGVIANNSIIIQRQGIREIGEFRKLKIRVAKQRLENLIDTLISLTEGISEEEVIKIVRKARYDEGEGYFWINDMSKPFPEMIIHPINANLDGRILDNEKYNVAMGRNENLFNAMVKVVEKKGEGFVDYLWPKPGEEKEQPKLSFVKEIKKGWIIGTGFYIDDIEKEVLIKKEQIKRQIQKLMFINVIFTIILFGLSSLMINYFVTKDMIDGIRRLLKHMDKVSEGNLEDRFEDIRNDEIGLVGERFKEMQEKLKIHRDNLEEIVNEKTESITNLLDNASQGFLSFGNDFVIDEKVSKQCKAIFGYDISGKDITEVLFSNNTDYEEGISVFREIIKKVLITDQKRTKIYLSLLQNEIVLNNRVVKIEYKVLETSEKIMVILTDVTEKREMQDIIDKEQNVLKMVVRTVTNSDEFFEIIEDYRDFSERRLDYIISNSVTVKEAIGEIFMEIHTFKGSFSHIMFNETAEKLHNLETAIGDLKNEKNSMTKEQLKSFMEAFNICDYDKEDIEIVKNVLGFDFLTKDHTIKVSKEKLIEIENFIVNKFGQEKSSQLVKELRTIRYKSVKKILISYNEYIYELAKALGKGIKNIEVEGKDVLVDYKIYRNFFRSMVHIFTNIVDHGIELPQERISLGKSEFGNIKCIIKKKNDCIIIEIHDDGRGIDVQGIKGKLLKCGLSRNELSKISDKDLIKSIFKSDFSTSKGITKLSGRGVGLSVIKSEIDKLNGKIEIETEKGKGTNFIFELPYIEE